MGEAKTGIPLEEVEGRKPTGGAEMELDGDSEPSADEAGVDDDEVGLHTGYTLLGFGPDSLSDSDSEQESESDAPSPVPQDASESAVIDFQLMNAINSGVEFGSFPSKEEKEIPDDSSPALLWNSHRSPQALQLSISEEKAAEIKACLANFRLPDTSCPPWAKQMPEDVWKTRLLSRLNNDNHQQQPTSK